MWCVAPVVVQIQDNNLGMMQVMVDTCKVILQFDDEHKEVGSRSVDGLGIEEWGRRAVANGLRMALCV